ncbi:MAG: glycosyltransferase [Candidatus Babeliaceae bacterium]|nr:glycosyltransferase [Candidatus Babeliaceae bacterium]
MKKLTTSVIICTRNRLTDILTFLPTLQDQTEPPTELIIVDSSTEQLKNIPAFQQLFNTDNFHKTRLLYLHTEPGLTFQRNCGIKKATGDIIFFFDDDVTLEKKYLEIMLKSYEQNPSFAGGMGTVTNIKSYNFNAYRIFRLLFLLDRNHASGNFTLSGMPTHTYGNNIFSTTQVLGGCCMSFTSWALKQEKFDEKLRFYGYMEDCDISKRLSDNHQLFYQPLAKLAHHESPLNRDKLKHNRAMYIANYSYLFFKNFYPQARWKILFYYWTVLGLLLEGILRFDKQVFFGYLLGLQHVLCTRAQLPYCPSTSTQNKTSTPQHSS